MFAGIDIASERHVLARLDDAGAAIGKPIIITEDRDGYDALLRALGPGPVLIVMEATGHYWKNLFAVLAAAGHEVALLNPLIARRSVGQHHGPAYTLQARHICQDLDTGRRRLAEIERDIENLLDTHVPGKLITSIDGIGPQTAARIIAATGDPARFKSAGAFAAFVGVVPRLRQSGKQTSTRAGTGPLGHARLRRALRMPVLSAVRRNPWLRTFYLRLRAEGKPARLALVAAMRKLLHAVYSVAKHRKPFAIQAEQAPAA